MSGVCEERRGVGEGTYAPMMFMTEIGTWEGGDVIGEGGHQTAGGAYFGIRDEEYAN